MTSNSWERYGLIFRPDNARSWMQTHASAPVPVHLDGDRYRVYFSSRDVHNRSHVGWFELDLSRPTTITDVSPDPVLVPGPLGYFDDHGIYAASAVTEDSTVYLYTIGWSPGVPTPLFYSSIGLAVSVDGGLTFEKHGESPLLARSEHDPSLVTSPFVIREGERWRMYYVSGSAWEYVDGQLHSNYDVKYAESDDGVRWRRWGHVCLETKPPAERNIARTCVVPTPDGYDAWYSFTREQKYRIGYARSADGLNWHRDDALAGIAPPASGWDSNAQAYPFVVRHGDLSYMFYNGNDFGRDGIGLAAREN